MISKVMRVHFQERKTTIMEPTRAHASQRRIQRVTEIAEQYLQQLAVARGAPLDTPDLILENRTDSPPDRCPHCGQAYRHLSGPWQIYKGRVYRVNRVTHTYELKCRTCKRWMPVPRL